MLLGCCLGDLDALVRLRPRTCGGVWRALDTCVGLEADSLVQDSGVTQHCIEDVEVLQLLFCCV